MKFIIPYIKNVTDRWVSKPLFTFYQSVKVPYLQGGKETRIVGNTALSVEEMRILIDQLGDRFRVLANSCFPGWSDEVHELCEIVNELHGNMVVARLKFAVELKSQYPNIKLHASVIMNFYEDWEKILNSPLFETVGGSQFNNNDTEKMIDSVPVEHRKRVVYLLLGCVWSKGCIRHYELPSLQYKCPNIVKDNFNNNDCTGRPGFKVDMVRLLDAGFELFKFGYRTPSEEQAVATLSRYIAKYQSWLDSRQLQSVLED